MKVMQLRYQKRFQQALFTGWNILVINSNASFLTYSAHV